MTSVTKLATRTVLVADDTEFVRDRFKTAIEDAGHHAIAVRTGQELLARLNTHPSEIDLVILDLHIPQGHGLTLLHAIRRLASPPAVMVFSGTIASADEVRQLDTLGVVGYVNEYTAVQHILPSLIPHLFPDGLNRRSSPRVVIGVPIAYRFGNTIAAALTLNLSHGGIAIRTTSPLAIGTSVRVRFRLPNDRCEVDAEARVSWTDRRVGMGLQFTKVSATDQVKIDAYVQSHFFSNRKA